jgi:arginase
MMNRRWEIIGAPFDFGSSHKGSEKAPAAIRDAGLTRRVRHFNSLGIDVVDGGDVELQIPSSPQKIPRGLSEMMAYAPALMARLDVSLRTGAVPMVLGGDHSISIACVSAVVDCLRVPRNPRASVGLIWVDAHPDLETPGADSTNDLNAMAAAHLLDLGVEELRTLRGFAPKVRPEHLIYIGLRDVVSQERQIIHDMRIAAYTMSDIERLGIVKVCSEAFAYMSERTDAFVLSFDIDALDPMVAPGVDYPEPGGLTFREAMVIMEFGNRSQKLALFELVEANPTKDRGEETSKVAVRLLHRIICGPVV